MRLQMYTILFICAHPRCDLCHIRLGEHLKRLALAEHVKNVHRCTLYCSYALIPGVSCTYDFKNIQLYIIFNEIVYMHC
jgi:hypothetical protein